MATHSAHHRARSRTHKQRGGVVAVVLAGLFVVCGIALLAGGLSMDRQDAEARRVFRAAPLCANGTADSSTCRLNAPMLVTDKWSDYGLKGHYYGIKAHCYLNLKTRSGDTYPLDFRRWNPLWEAVSPGQVVDTQRWQDRVISLSAGRLTIRTRYFPDTRPGDLPNGWTWIAGFFLGLFVLFFIMVVIRAIQGKPDGFVR